MLVFAFGMSSVIDNAKLYKKTLETERIIKHNF